MAGRDRMTIEEVVRQVLRDEHADVIRESVRVVAQELMEAEISELIGAQHGERTEIGRRIATSTAPGAGIRVRVTSSCRSRRCAKAATSRRFRSRASAPSRRSCRWSSRPTSAACRPSCRSARRVARAARLKERGQSDRRPARRAGHGVSGAAVGGPLPVLVRRREDREGPCRRPRRQKVRLIAHAVHETGRREIIGLDVGEAETEAFWTEFLRSLVARGLVGVQLAISDAHPGLKAANARVLGASWERCTVHFLRDLRGHCRKDQHDALGALIRQLFTATDGVEARRRLADAISELEVLGVIRDDVGGVIEGEDVVGSEKPGGGPGLTRLGVLPGVGYSP